MNELVTRNQFDLTYRNEKSYNGIRIDLLKSAIQKFIRRDNLESGIWCLVELLTFGLIEKNNIKFSEQLEIPANKIVSKAKGIQTNTINRLIVMMSEEVGISNWCLPIIMKKLYTKWLKTKKFKYPIEMFINLCKSKKLRFLSDIKATYKLPIKKIDDRLLKLHKRVIKNVGLKLPKNKSHKNLYKKIEKCLKNKSLDAFYYIKLVLEETLAEKGYPMKCEQYIKLWKLINDFIETRIKSNKFKIFLLKATEALEFFFSKMKHAERFLYLYQAVLMLVKRGEIDKKLMKKNKYKVTSKKVKCLFKINLKGNTLPLDEPYLHDKNTRTMGNKTTKYFVLESSKILHEDIRFDNKIYRRIYLKMGMNDPKYEPDEPDESSNGDFVYKTVRKLNLKKAIIAQKVTAGYKKPTYITKKWIYKGPFDKNSKVLKIVYQRTKKFSSWNDRAFVPNRIIKYDNEYYLKMPNIGPVPKYEITWYLPNDRITLGKVAIRSKDRKDGPVQLSHEFMTLSDKEWLGILYHFILRYITQSGDTGPWNVINGFGIDYEDTRKDKDPKSFMDAMFNKKLNSQFLNKMISKIKLYRKKLITKIKKYVKTQNREEILRRDLILEFLELNKISH